MQPLSASTPTTVNSVPLTVICLPIGSTSANRSVGHGLRRSRTTLRPSVDVVVGEAAPAADRVVRRRRSSSGRCRRTALIVWSVPSYVAVCERGDHRRRRSSRPAPASGSTSASTQRPVVERGVAGSPRRPAGRRRCVTVSVLVPSALDAAPGSPWPSRCRPRPAGSPRPTPIRMPSMVSAGAQLVGRQPAQREPDDLDEAHRVPPGQAPTAAVERGCRTSLDDLAVDQPDQPAWRASATSCSWVISTIVRPAALSRSKTPSTSAVELAVQVAGRLVGQQQRRRGDQRPGHRDPLLLAAGELVRLVAGPVGQADQVQRGQGPAAPLGRLAPRRTPAAARRWPARSSAGSG